MEELRICFTSPSTKAYSETFIQNLKNGIDGVIFHCYGDLFPFLSLRGVIQNYKTPPFQDIFFHRLDLIKRPLREHYLLKYLKANNINLILANYGPSGALLAPIAQQLNIPLIVHFHGYDASIYSVLDKYRSAYQIMFETANRFIVVSEEMKNDLLQLGAPEEKLIKITYAPHSRFLEIKPSYKGNQILAIGRFVEKKAPYLTLMAFKKAKKAFPDLHIKFVGTGDLLSICQDLCISLNIKGVEFSGVLSAEEIAFEMSQSFCFIQHSKQASNGDKEGTPVAILEAMAAGLPIISTRHAGIPEVVEDGSSGFLVDEGDVDGMADKIMKLHLNREKAQNFGENGKAFISQNLDQSEYYKKVNSMIREVLKNG
ncbi:glycosyltransferase [Algoriphagus sp. PAP.12]|uniref:glycosyltransferase n=1 Tax=Algoriphagus sp. PAP.12 TaxID=2996678 RepID=UPI00227B5BF4|nr:glycosyltransferase [Algoriphagus sp. PAP.12]